MDKEILYHFLLIGIVVLGIFTNSVDFNPIKFHCDNYVLNTYLYFILSWAIVMATNVTLSKNKVALRDIFSGPSTILIFIGSLALLVAVYFTPPKFFFTKHFLYIAQVILLGLFLYPYYVNNKVLFKHIGLSTLLLLIVLSVVVFAMPELVKDYWGAYLLIGVLGVLIARIIEMVINPIGRQLRSRVISYISVVLFSLLVMYDTKKVIVHSQNCVNPDYINESLNLFLDSLNLFQNNYMLNN
tara:strand:+ start:1285 stop:2010 length:726 start_codon:yes stop_codon:yes gene_type:complete